MSAIVHRCVCGHIDLWHRYEANTDVTGNKCDGNVGVKACPCGKLRTSDPEIIPTWDAVGKPAPLRKPGTKCLGRQTCACPACVALYAQQTVPA